jgi:hypothetical protein
MAVLYEVWKMEEWKEPGLFLRLENYLYMYHLRLG